MKSRNIFWGVFFICAGGLVILHQMGYLTQIGIWSLIFTVLLIPVIIKSIQQLNFFGIVFPAALLLVIYAKPIGIENLSIWGVLVAAAFLGLGLSIIFNRRRHYPTYEQRDEPYHAYSGPAENNDENTAFFSESFGSSSKYLHSQDLKRADIRCSFGALKVYFDNALPAQNGAEIYFDCSFSGVELYIPHHWNVVNNIDVFAGGVDEKKRRFNTTDGPLLILKGRLQFGGIEIIYI